MAFLYFLACKLDGWVGKESKERRRLCWWHAVEGPVNGNIPHCVSVKTSFSLKFCYDWTF